MNDVDSAVHPFVWAPLVCRYDHPDRVAHDTNMIDREVRHEAHGVLVGRDKADASRQQIVGNKLHDRSAIRCEYRPRR